MLANTLLSFAIGIGMMAVSAEVFIRIIQRAAANWRLSPLFVSFVLVGMGTNLPELALTLTALRAGDPSLAMGNLVGSSLVNITIVIGIVSLVGQVKVGTRKTLRNALLLFGIATLFVSLRFSSMSLPAKGATLLVALALSLVYQYIAAKNGSKHEDRRAITELVKVVKKKKRKLPGVVYALAFLGSSMGLGLGGYIIVETVTQLSTILGLSTAFLGLTLTGLATSFPELVLTSLAAREKKNKVILGTLFGGASFTLTLHPSIIYLANRQVNIVSAEFIFLLISALLAAVVIVTHKGKVIPKKISLLFIGMFIAFIYITSLAMH
jgi:cation:H+ antiporter